METKLKSLYLDEEVKARLLIEVRSHKGDATSSVKASAVHQEVDT